MPYASLPPLSWIRAFECSARHLSFTQAALELSLTQAAISKQIRLLEQHLRQRLFVRLPRRVALTKSGEAYLPKVRDALERLNSGTQEVFGRLRSDVVTIRCAVSFAVSWLAPRMPDFLKKHPRIKIRFISSIWNEDNTDHFDLDIQYGTGRWKSSICHRLTHEKLTPLCSASIAKGLRRPADLGKHALIHVLGYQDGWSTWLKAAGVDGIDPGSGIQCDTSLTAFALAGQNCGVALARSSLMGDVIEPRRLIAPFELAVPVEEAFYLVVSEHSLAPEAERFVDWLLDARDGAN